MDKTYDVLIVGAGAAGLMAAGVSASLGLRVLLLEKMEKSGRKIRITGKGRCNITNNRDIDVLLEKVRNGASFVRPALEQFDPLQTVRFFEGIGVPVEVERGGRVFPKSGKAWDVADGLTGWALREGAQIRYHSPVTKIHMRDGRVTGLDVNTIAGEKIHYEASKIILTTGGMSYPSTGSTGDGYRLAYETGHRIEPVRPSLVPLEADMPPLERLKGLQLKNVSLTLLVDGQPVQEAFGEMEFTGFGVMGAIVLQVSRKAVDAIIDGHDTAIVLDLKPALTQQQIINRIDREALETPSLTCEGLFRKFVPRQMVGWLVERSGIDASEKVLRYTPEQKQKTAGALKNLSLTIMDYRPFEEAVVTAGGIDLDQVNPLTMESRLIRGLYFAGEVLDIDADTGGYNLQLAFSTGRLAGRLLEQEDYTTD